MKHKYAKINGINIHYVESGIGRLVILLHGFPEYGGAWKHQIKELSKLLNGGCLPQYLIDATISIEDQNFYGHFGVDLVAIFRALSS